MANLKFPRVKVIQESLMESTQSIILIPNNNRILTNHKTLEVWDTSHTELSVQANTHTNLQTPTISRVHSTCRRCKRIKDIAEVTVLLLQLILQQQNHEFEADANYKLNTVQRDNNSVNTCTNAF